jgi:signal transduction histidine kinase
MRPTPDPFFDTPDAPRDGFLRSVAHELRTPLQALRMLVEVLRRTAEAGEPVEPSLRRRIDGEFDRLSEMVDRLSDAGGRSHAEIRGEPLDLGLLLRRLAESYNETLRAPSVRARHVLRYRGPEHAPMLGERRSLRQAFGGLLENAVKFSPRGGVIELRLEERDGELLVKVRDQGIGIPKNEIPMAARRFFRASNAPREHFPGSGLGLCGARDVVERHGGSLEIESDVDRGTCVTARLPAGAHAP